MKGNDGTGNTPERDSWQTNQELFDKLNKQYSFEVDCCATEYNSKCITFLTDFKKHEEIKECCWMNPPFSKSREMFEHFFKTVKSGVCIYRCDNMETKLWQEVILKNASWIFIPVGRISYYCYKYTRTDGKRNDARFPSALIGFNVDHPKELEGYSLIVQEANK